MTNNQLLVSVIIPAYNSEKTLSKSLESAIGQSYLNLEIIVINDGSNDNTENILNRYAQKDCRIKPIHKRQNEGLVRARKTGVESAQGKYIQYLDSDDTLEEKAIEFLIEKAEKTNAEIVVAPFLFVENGVPKPSTMLNFDQMTGEEYLKEILNQNAYWCIWSKFHLKTLYDNVIERPNISFGEDVVLSTQLLLYSTKVVSIDYNIIHYNITPESMSHPKTFNESKYQEFNAYIEWFIGYIEKNKLTKKYNKELCFFYIKNTFLRLYFRRTRDFCSEIELVLERLKQYPDLINKLTKREHKIIKTYQHSKFLGFLNIKRYQLQGKI